MSSYMQFPHYSTFVGLIPFKGLSETNTPIPLESFKVYYYSIEKQRVLQQCCLLSTRIYFYGSFGQERNVLIKSTLDIYKQDFSTTFFDSSVMAFVRDFK